MTEQSGGDTNMDRVVDGNRGDNAIPKQVRTNRLPQSVTRARQDDPIDPGVAHCGAAHLDSQSASLTVPREPYNAAMAAR